MTVWNSATVEDGGCTFARQRIVPLPQITGFDCSQLFTLPHHQVRNTLRPRHVPGEDPPVFTGFFCQLTCASRLPILSLNPGLAQCCVAPDI
jgi:hypothetical protein